MIIIIILLVIFLVLFICFIIKDKITICNLKLENIEERINSTLIKRKELLKESENKIKEILKTDKNIYENFDKLTEDNYDMIKFDRKLLIYINEFHLIKEKYKKLQGNEDFIKLSFRINETEDLLKAYKSYYNNAAEKYNRLIKSFPINIVSIFKKWENKSFFDNSVEDNNL